MLKIGVAAHSQVKSESHEKHVRIFIEKLNDCLSKLNIKDKTYLLVGGYWGLMKTLVDEAIKNKIKVIILPPSEMDSEEYYPKDTIVIRTGLSMRGRSIALVRSSNILVSLGGAAGTILEIIAAYTENVPVYALINTDLPSDKITIYSPYIDDRKNAIINAYESVQELAFSLCSYVEKLTKGE